MPAPTTATVGRERSRMTARLPERTRCSGPEGGDASTPHTQAAARAKPVKRRSSAADGNTARFDRARGQGRGCSCLPVPRIDEQPLEGRDDVAQGGEGLEGDLAAHELVGQGVLGEDDVGGQGAAGVRHPSVSDVHGRDGGVIPSEGFDAEALAHPGSAEAVGILAPDFDAPAPGFDVQAVGLVGEAHVVDDLKAVQVVVEAVREHPKRHAVSLAPGDELAGARVEVDGAEEGVDVRPREVEAREDLEVVVPGRDLAAGVAFPEGGAEVGDVPPDQGRTDVLHREGPVEVAEDRERATPPQAEERALARGEVDVDAPAGLAARRARPEQRLRRPGDRVDPQSREIDALPVRLFGRVDERDDAALRVQRGHARRGGRREQIEHPRAAGDARAVHRLRRSPRSRE